MIKNFIKFATLTTLIMGAKCSPESKKEGVLSAAATTAAPAVTTVTTAAASAIGSGDISSYTGPLRFRLEGMAGVYVDKIAGDQMTVRVWDWEHQAKPDAPRDIPVTQVLNNKDSSGDYIYTPVFYVEVLGMTCPANEPPDTKCNEIRLKLDAAFEQKLHDDPAFRTKVGSNLGREFTVPKNRLTLRMEDLK